MGISDDIKPKKAYRYVEKKAETKSSVDNLKNAESSEKIPQTEIKHEELYVSKTTLEDDFFNAQEHESKQIKKKEKGRKTPNSGITRKVLWLLVILIVVFAIYKNFNHIKELVFEELTPISNTEEDDSIYTNTENESLSNVNISEQNSPQSVPEVAAESTAPSNSIAKASIKVEVLNGNGIRGSADKVSDLLITSGFTVDKVANAKKFTYASTIIYYKTGKEDAANLVQSVLANNYTCEKTLSDTLTSGYDIVVVVGKN